jgi:PPM family protein phosphatase
MVDLAEFGPLHSEMRLTYGAATAVGKVRKLNEDAFLTGEGIVAVADGMGGHKAGEVASQITIEACAALVSSEPISLAAIERLIGTANSRVREHALAHDSLGMGTTLVGAAVVDNAGESSLLVFNVGDSRCYAIVDGGPMVQLTIDHSVVQEMVDNGEISADEARLHAHRNVVTRAIGIEESVAADFVIAPQGRHVRLLLCSDGVSGEVSDAQLSILLRESETPDEVARAIIASVLEGFAKDNATAVVLDVRVEESEAPVELSELDPATGPRPTKYANLDADTLAMTAPSRVSEPQVTISKPPPPPPLLIDSVLGPEPQRRTDESRPSVVLTDEVPL